MPQHDYAIADQPGAAFRGDINNALAAILGTNSGATAPAVTAAGMLWFDTSTTPPTLRIRNNANTAWNRIAQFDTGSIAISDAMTILAAAAATNPAQLQQVVLDNGIVNGALSVWQYGTSFTGIAHAAFIADNLRYLKVGTVVHDAARVADSTSTAAPGMVFARARMTLTTAQAAMAAGDYCALRTYIEGYQWRRYKADQFTLRFLVKLPLAGTYCYSIQNSAQDYSYVGEFAYATANADQLITVTVPTPPAGTWLFDNGIGARLSIALASGTTLGDGVVGWQTGNKLATVNQVNSLNVATTSTYELALLRIDAGPVARPWSAVDFDFGHAYARCQRLRAKTYMPGVTPGTATALGSLRLQVAVANSGTLFWRFPVEMRATPAVTLYRADTGAAGAFDNGSAERAAAPINISTAGCSVNVSVGNDGELVQGHAVADANFPV